MNIEQIWPLYQNHLRNFIAKRIENSADVEDLLQEVLIKTYQNLAKIKNISKFKAWLFQLTRHTIGDYYRQKQRESMLSLIQEAPEPEEYELVRQELSHCIRPFIEQLPEPYRTAVLKVDLEGSSQKELAKELGISYSGLKSRVQRGRKLLANIYDDCCDFRIDIRGNVIEYERKTQKAC